MGQVKWQRGPGTAKLGDIAKIELPKGYLFAGANDTRRLMEAMHNPPSGAELGFIAPEAMDWFCVFEFVDTGYVKDDEKNSLDADAILNSLKRGNEKGNEERRKKGWTELNIVGWEVPPNYDATSHHLQWAVRVQDEDGLAVNHNERILGRRGIMKATLVTDPNLLSSALVPYKSLLSEFGFQGGHRYEEFVQGDKIAKYGLTGLIVGGAAAAAVKGGLFKYLWKILVAVGIAMIVFFRKLFGRLFGNK
jgi:uncharacterized membrane-anchored protein